MTDYERTDLDEALRALKSDLLGPEGPRISTTRNYNFAILHPRRTELKLRRPSSSSPAS
jgi:hypothetical protein